MSDAQSLPEPSMEEILASVRRILAEDEHGAQLVAPRVRAAADVLDLTEAIGDDGTVRHIEPAAMRAPAAAVSPTLPDGRVEPAVSLRAGPADHLVSAAAVDAAATSFARLAGLPKAEPGG